MWFWFLKIESCAQKDFYSALLNFKGLCVSALPSWHPGGKESVS